MIKLMMMIKTIRKTKNVEEGRRGHEVNLELKFKLDYSESIMIKI